MAQVTPVSVPQGSLLASFGEPHHYRDCFMREEVGAVTLPDFIERFYCSWAFRPERLALGAIGKGASSDDARALARGEVDSFAAWNLIERDETQILMQDFQKRTASWLCVEPTGGATKLYFGSWVGEPDHPAMKALMGFHIAYSKVLLGAV